MYAQRAPSNSDVDFLLSQVSHLEGKWERKTIIFWKKEGAKSVFSLLFHRFFGGENAGMLKHAQKPTIIHCIIEDYEEACDTCDSKNTKTPVYTRVCSRVREGGYRYFHTIQHLVFRISISDTSFVCCDSKLLFEKIHVDCKK